VSDLTSASNCEDVHFVPRLIRNICCDCRLPQRVLNSWVAVYIPVLSLFTILSQM